MDLGAGILFKHPNPPEMNLGLGILFKHPTPPPPPPLISEGRLIGDEDYSVPAVIVVLAILIAEFGTPEIFVG